VLLHIWSLSVEEQFYLIWPLSIVLSFKYFSKRVVIFIAALTFGLSLVANLILVNFEVASLTNQTEMMFYLTPFRAYEFLIGALGVWAMPRLFKSKLVHELLFAIGLLAITVAVVGYSSKTPFPYYFALLPCVGALCIILAKDSKLSKLFLANKVMVSIGLISYSLYLVHWPVIVFLKYFRFADLTSLDIVIALIVSFALSTIIYFGVEKRYRFSGSQGSSDLPVPNLRFLNGCAVIASALVLLSLVSVLNTDILGDRNELITQKKMAAGKAHRYDLIRKSCRILDLSSVNCQNEASSQILIPGDSHEVDGYNIFHTMFGHDRSINLIQFGGTNHCDLVSGTSTSEISSKVKKNGCDIRVSKLNDREFAQSIDLVVFSSNRPFAPHELKAWRMLKRIETLNSNVKTLVIGTYFNTVRPCAEIVNRFKNFAACRKAELLAYAGNTELDKLSGSRLNAEVSKIFGTGLKEGRDFIYLSKFSALCDSEGFESCPTEANGEPMFYDAHHLSMGFAKFVADRFLKVYKTELEDTGFVFATDNHD